MSHNIDGIRRTLAVEDRKLRRFLGINKLRGSSSKPLALEPFKGRMAFQFMFIVVIANVGPEYSTGQDGRCVAGQPPPSLRRDRMEA